MSASRPRHTIALGLGAAVLLIAALATLNRDAIAERLLKGGDTTLTGAAAHASPQAQLALDFLAALRASDLPALERLTTPEQADRIRQESTTPTPDYQEMTATMLADLPADPTELRALIKHVQLHEDRGAVTFETPANSWFVTLASTDSGWRVAGF
jgi:hypothetical protein